MPQIKGGYYIKARKIQESEIMKKPPYMRDIWDYLMREANHKDKNVYGRTIKRGQLFRTFKRIIDDLSWLVGYRKESYNKWQCEKTMIYLRQRGMIATMRTTRGLLITICNYDFYQDPKNYESNTKATTKATREQLITDSINKNGLKNVYKNVENGKKFKTLADKSAKKKKIKKPTNPNVKVFIDSFYDTFKVKTGAPYLVLAKDASLIKRLLGTYSLEELQKLKDLFFNSTDEFIGKAGFTIGIFSSQINKLISGSENSRHAGIKAWGKKMEEKVRKEEEENGR